MSGWEITVTSIPIATPAELRRDADAYRIFAVAFPDDHSQGLCMTIAAAFDYIAELKEQ